MSKSMLGRVVFVAVVLMGVMGAVVVYPASAHIGGVSHSWTHFKPKVEALLGDEFLWAVVNPNGTLARGSGATGATKSGTGTYVVTFDQNISSCSYTATSWDSAAGASAVYARVETGAANGLTSAQVRVGIINTSSATLVDFGSSIQVMC